jgi:3-phosphoshikimate 1-carboxyvinyltransferase
MGNEPVASLIGLPSALTGATIPPELVPLAIDEFPLIFALAACAKGETRVTGAAELRHKESDRIAVMIQALRKLGIDAEESADGARIAGGRPCGGTVDSHDDHRVAMALAVAGMMATAPVTILNVDNVATSFPGFVPAMQSLGLDLQYEPGSGK